MNNNDFIANFKSVMLGQGITPPLEFIADGEHHHFKTDNGDPVYYGLSMGLTQQDGVFWRGWSGYFGTGGTLVSIQTLVRFGEAEESWPCQ